MTTSDGYKGIFSYSGIKIDDLSTALLRGHLTGKVVHIHLAKIVHDFCTCIVDSYATDIYYKDTSLHHMTADLQISILI